MDYGLGKEKVYYYGSQNIRYNLCSSCKHLDPDFPEPYEIM
jgi:hypothetical protein